MSIDATSVHTAKTYTRLKEECIDSIHKNGSEATAEKAEFAKRFIFKMLRATVIQGSPDIINTNLCL